MYFHTFQNITHILEQQKIVENNLKIVENNKIVQMKSTKQTNENNKKLFQKENYFQHITEESWKLKLRITRKILINPKNVIYENVYESVYKYEYYTIQKNNLDIFFGISNSYGFQYIYVVNKIIWLDRFMVGCSHIMVLINITITIFSFNFFCHDQILTRLNLFIDYTC